MLNSGDEGLLRSLEKLSAAQASALTPTGSSIAAHVDHVRYGMSLMNRWSQGENPFASADWSASWRKNERIRTGVAAAPRRPAGGNCALARRRRARRVTSTRSS